VRQLRVGWAAVGPDKFWISAVCDDWQCHMLLTKPDRHEVETYLVTGEEAVHSDAYYQMVTEHQDGCPRCRDEVLYVLWEGPTLIHTSGLVH
jgi:hypothetical protein